MPRRNNTARCAATLLEVLLGLALLGTVAVAMLMARGRLLDQKTRAEHAAVATQALDEQLSAWWTGEGVPREGSGEIAMAEERTLRWEATSLGLAADKGFDAEQGLELASDGQPPIPGEVVRIDVYGGLDTEDARPLVTVELLLPDEVLGEEGDENAGGAAGTGGA